MLPQVAKLIRKAGLPVSSLCELAIEVVAGRLGAGEADLGGGLFKKRLRRVGMGKSGGFRVIVAYRPPRGDRVLCAYAFAKNVAATLTPAGHAALAQVAAGFVRADDDQVLALLGRGDIIEVECGGEG